MKRHAGVEQFLVGVAILVWCTSGCSIDFKAAPADYFFSNSLLNNQWQPRLCRHADGKPKIKKHRRRTKRVAKKSTAKKRNRKVVAKKTPAPVLLQPLRGNDLKVVREEMVLSAQRLVGIRNSFSQDTFARHLLTVNNLGVGGVPKTDVVGWLHKATAAGKGRLLSRVEKGDLLFLGEDGPEMLVVAEAVETDGTVTFIGYIAGEVKRGVLSLKHRQARRDEATQKVLNSFVGKSQLAGELLVGVSSLSDEGNWLAGQAR